MIPSGSPQLRLIIKSTEEAPGSAPERLQQTEDKDNFEKQKSRKARRELFPNKSIIDAPDYPDHYLTLPCGYNAVINEETIEPALYQPTPEGLQLLIDNFERKTGLSIELLDQATVVENKLCKRFTHAKDTIDAAFSGGSLPKAIILSYGQMHAVPVLLARKGLEKHLIILDSTSGGIVPHYYAVANAFVDYKVMLNRSTRQADSQSCITDAFEILCRVLEIKDVGELIANNAENASALPLPVEPDDRPRFFVKPTIDHDNFYLFNMPEELCFTAQRSEFLEANHVDFNKKFQHCGEVTSIARELMRSREISQYQVVGLADDSEKTEKELGKEPEKELEKEPEKELEKELGKEPEKGLEKEPKKEFEKEVEKEVEKVTKYRVINHYLYEASVRHKQIIDSTLSENQEDFALLSAPLSNLPS